MKIIKLLLNLFVILFFLGSAAAPGAGATLTVDDSGDANYTTIQEAIDNAEDGDTILVYPGIYAENVEVYKELSIVSESGESENTFIISNSPEADVLYVVADNVTIEGFSVLGVLSETGSISDADWPDVLAGVFIDGAEGCRVSNSTIIGNDVGIFLREANGAVLYSNVLTLNYWDGIDLIDSSGCVLSDNVVARNERGIYVEGSVDNVLLNNIISTITYEALTLLECSNSTLENNIITGSELGVYFERSVSNIMSNSTVEWNYEGIFLSNSTENLFYGNEFANEINAVDYGTNSWNTTVGNSWSDYAGEDSDGDGIGDTPYVINESTESIDYLPITGLPVSDLLPGNNLT
ncbi:right-handed parallel beta-helix repeat-containing protein [Methanosarcina sp. Mfa9]|uniref:right-handed parallel beta-helix repeat-containing protein n=1 Tax=Methanosarcina sp. Mfa9 TaxID=3439063 RepID=UPI003F86B525